MKVRYDPEVDTLYLRFTESAVVESEEIRQGVVFDFDADGKIIAIEVLDAADRMADGADYKSLAVA